MPRLSKVSLKQYEILADFAETHQHITMSSGCSRNLRLVRDAWESAALLLNAEGKEKKTPEQWRRFWIDYKARIKARAADVRRSSGGNNLLALTEREQRLVELINRVAAEGVTDSNVSDVRNKSSSPEPSNDIEWLSYESDSDDDVIKPKTESQSDELHSESELLQADKNEPENKKRKLQNIIKKHQLSTARQSQKKSSPYKERRGNSSLNHVTEKHFSTKRSESSGSSVSQDPDLSFFHSILPEMKQMNPEQKRQFKMGVWSLAGRILESKSVNDDPLSTVDSSFTRRSINDYLRTITS